MELIRGLSECPVPGEGCVVSVGNFDGFHRGHQAVVEMLVEEASATGLCSAVVTFDRHPLELLRPDTAPCRLTTPEQKVDLLGETDLDYVCLLEFDQEMADTEADEFVRDVLSGCLRAREVVVGDDFKFGRNRKGDLSLLREMGQAQGFKARRIDIVKEEGARISSTRIRSALAEGEVEWAKSALGRPHLVFGRVVPGERRGRSLGFPTANLDPVERICIPGDGVYAGWIRVSGDRDAMTAAINVGKRPTFGPGRDSLVEVHILDFDGDIYGADVVVAFESRVRGEYRFSGPDELITQISRDIDEVRAAASDWLRQNQAGSDSAE